MSSDVGEQTRAGACLFPAFWKLPERLKETRVGAENRSGTPERLDTDAPAALRSIGASLSRQVNTAPAGGWKRPKGAVNPRMNTLQCSSCPAADPGPGPGPEKVLKVALAEGTFPQL